ncbi:MAG: C40 family peptidase [Armatimonadetes bacterium]|nr:C40 family peptidase [Armatimonadota bacterium]MDE2206606.1 C40 family peptidase [Armatimonadota bacterium]
MEMRIGRATTALTVSSLRAEPHERAEVVSQSVLGETVQVLEHSGPFVRLETPDGYTGWLLRSHLQMAATAGQRPSGEPAYVSSAFATFTRRSVVANSLLAPFGAEVLRIRARAPAGRFAVAWPQPRGWRFGTVDACCVTVERPAFAAETVCRLAAGFAGAPYLWGGVTPFGFDCSGLVQRVFGWCGVRLPRDAWMQAGASGGRVITAAEALEPADLVFFRAAAGTSSRAITHVALCLSSERLVHASVNGVEIVRRHSAAMRSRYEEVSAWRCSA